MVVAQTYIVTGLLCSSTKELLFEDCVRKTAMEVYQLHESGGADMHFVIIDIEFRLACLLTLGAVLHKSVSGC